MKYLLTEREYKKLKDKAEEGESRNAMKYAIRAMADMLVKTEREKREYFRCIYDDGKYYDGYCDDCPISSNNLTSRGIKYSIAKVACPRKQNYSK